MRGFRYQLVIRILERDLKLQDTPSARFSHRLLLSFMLGVLYVVSSSLPTNLVSFF
jgi:hypothetical protein